MRKPIKTYSLYNLPKCIRHCPGTRLVEVKPMGDGTPMFQLQPNNKFRRRGADHTMRISGGAGGRG